MRSITSLRLALALALCAGVGSATAQTRLITEEEARAPSAAVASTRAITRGPGISLLTPPEVSAKSFNFKVAFEPRGGAKIDPASVKFEYLKQPLVDLTPRLKPALQGNVVELANASVPPGAHAIRVSVRDSEGREGHSVIQLNAK